MRVDWLKNLTRAPKLTAQTLALEAAHVTNHEAVLWKNLHVQRAYFCLGLLRPTPERWRQAEFAFAIPKLQQDAH
jgi:hypothetical protein